MVITHGVNDLFSPEEMNVWLLLVAHQKTRDTYGAVRLHRELLCRGTHRVIMESEGNPQKARTCAQE